MDGTSSAILWVRGGLEDGRTINLTKGMTFIGRAPTNDVVVDHTGASRQHAGIRIAGNGYWIEDLGSRNGTFVNGTEVEGEGQKLRDHDRIELGGTDTAVRLVFRESGGTVTVEVPRG